jgi:hypothetical protein
MSESVSVHTANLVRLEIGADAVKFVFGQKRWSPGPESVLWDFREKNTHSALLEIKIFYQMQLINLILANPSDGVLSVHDDATWCVTAVLTDKLQDFIDRNRLRGGKDVDIGIFFAGN